MDMKLNDLATQVMYGPKIEKVEIKQSAVFFCTPHIDYRQVKVRKCPHCKVRRRMLIEHEEWYGSTVTCLYCGDIWQDGELLDRPFERGWRKRRVKAAKERAQELISWQRTVIQSRETK